MTNHRADHVGSLLRPPEIKDARASFAAGRINRERLTEIEDQAILAAIARQKAIGIEPITDGEFRRSGFQNDMQDAVEGFTDVGMPAVVRTWQGPGSEPQEQGTRLVVNAKLKQVRRLTGSQTAFLKQHSSGPFKMTVPSPNQFPAITYHPGITDPHYASRSELLWDLVPIIKREIAGLLADGVPYIQMDEPRYSYYVDPKWREHLRQLGEDPETSFAEAVAADNACLSGARRDGVTIAMHICRGNNQSMWYAEGGYEPIAEKVFGEIDVDRLLLEYDTDRAGTFEPLRFVPKDKTVVLGLVSSKDPALENQDELLRRIEEASAFFPTENLALSPQCGFASMAAGNLLTEDEQWRKLELVVDTARRVWG